MMMKSFCSTSYTPLPIRKSLIKNIFHQLIRNFFYELILHVEQIHIARIIHSPGGCKGTRPFLGGTVFTGSVSDNFS